MQRDTRWPAVSSLRNATLAALLFLPSMGALVHLALKSSVPARDARLAAAPRRIHLVFTQKFELATAGVSLRGPDSTEIVLGPPRVDSVVNLFVDIVGPIGPGRHTVTWRVAGADGHPVRGTFAFTVLADTTRLPVDSITRAPDTSVVDEHAAHMADPPTGIPPANATSFEVGSPAFVAVRWMGLAALIATVGSIAFALVVAAPLARGNDWTRDAQLLPATALVGAIGSGVLFIGGVLRLLAQSAALNGSSGFLDGAALAPLIFDTGWGSAWMVQMGASVVALASLLAARRSVSAGWTLAAIAALAIAVADAMSGHAASAGGLRLAAVGAHTIHLLAASGWVGGLLMVTVVAARRIPSLDPARRIAALAGVVRAFSPLALGSAIALALSGTIAGAIHMRSLGALWDTRYGTVLLWKLAFVAGMALLGWFNWRRVTPALTTDSGSSTLRRTATSELLVGALILLVTAVLVAVPPPAELVAAIANR